MDTKKIGIRINSALALRNMKQKELAKILNVTDNTISYFCSGSRTPKIEQLIKIAEALNVTTDYLLGLTEDPEKKHATADDLCLSALALKRMRYLASCSASDRLYTEITSKLLESDRFLDFIYWLYMECQMNIAEIVYNSTWTENYDSQNTEHQKERDNRILLIAQSGEFNSAVSGYLRQMVRFEQQQSILDEDDRFPHDCNFGKEIIPELVKRATQEAFEALKRDVCQTATHAAEREIREKLKNGNY